jgi:hypothetical protein
MLLLEGMAENHERPSHTGIVFICVTIGLRKKGCHEIIHAMA